MEENSRGSEKMGKRELMVRFKELRARCKELKEQEGTTEHTPSQFKDKSPRHSQKKKDVRCFSERDIDQEEEVMMSPSKKAMTQSNSATHLKSLLTKENPSIPLVVKKKPSHHGHSASTASKEFLLFFKSNFLIKRVKIIHQV